VVNGPTDLVWYSLVTRTSGMTLINLCNRCIELQVLPIGLGWRILRKEGSKTSVGLLIGLDNDNILEHYIPPCGNSVVVYVSLFYLGFASCGTL
jgi:hypothetical protein